MSDKSFVLALPEELLERAQAAHLDLREVLIEALEQKFPPVSGESATQAKTGAEIVAMLQTMEPIEFVDPHIEDPVEWLKEQRRKRADKLRPYPGGKY